MLGLEIVLIAIGAAFIIVSFRITESLNPKELEHLGQLSSEQLKKIIDRELKNATVDIDHRLGDIIDESMLHVDDVLGRETNNKIMAISEFSDGVIDKINKNHEEVMFLYNMLNDKHVELTDFASQVAEMTSNIPQTVYVTEPKPVFTPEVEQQVAPPANPQPEPEPEPENSFHNTRPFTNFDSLDENDLFDKDKVIEERQALDIVPDEEPVKPSKPKAKAPEPVLTGVKTNHNQQILDMFNQGKDIMTIARELKLGIGEVKLVVELYKGAR